MGKEEKRIPLKYRIWKEGKYIDLWNIPHFLVSLLFGFIFISLNISLSIALVLIITIKTTWEIYEHAYVTKEQISNKIFDVITGIVAVLVIYYLQRYYPMTLPEFITILILAMIFGLWGLYSMKKLNLFIKRK